ncbi:MAG: DUF3846 domain-containing protein [Vulcanimicrobiaceae bacterium]
MSDHEIVQRQYERVKQEIDSWPESLRAIPSDQDLKIEMRRHDMAAATTKQKRTHLLAVVKRPGEPAEQVLIEEGLKSLQAIVGGYIESIGNFSDFDALGDTFSMYANEDGKLQELASNFPVYHGRPSPVDIIAGPVVVVGFDADTGDSITLTQNQADAATRLLNNLAQRMEIGVKTPPPSMGFSG